MSTPRVLSYAPTTYSMDVHSPGHAECPCLRESQRFGIRPSANGTHSEWDETYMQRRNELGVDLDFGHR